MAFDLSSLLASQVPSEQQYYAEDPFYNAGKSILNYQFKPANKWEALLGPIAQGLVGGGILGYGQRNAAESAFDDARNSPYLAPLLENKVSNQFVGPLQEGDSYVAPSLEAYLAEQAPDDFTPRKARNDILTGLLQTQQAQELAAEKQKSFLNLSNDLVKQGKMIITDPKTGEQTIAAAPGFAEAEAESAGMKKAAETEAEKTGGLKLNDTKINELRESKALADEGLALAKRLRKGDISWLNLQGGQYMSALDKDGVAASLMDHADRALRLRSGATAPDKEKADMKKLKAGDFSIGVERTAEILENAARREAAYSKSELDAGKGGIEEMRNEFSQIEKGISDVPEGAPRYEIRTAPNGQRYKVLLGQ